MRVLIFYLSFDEHIPLKHFELQVSGSSEFGLWTHHPASSVSDAALILWVYGRKPIWCGKFLAPLVLMVSFFSLMIVFVQKAICGIIREHSQSLCSLSYPKPCFLPNVIIKKSLINNYWFRIFCENSTFCNSVCLFIGKIKSLSELMYITSSTIVYRYNIVV